MSTASSIGPGSTAPGSVAPVAPASQGAQGAAGYAVLALAVLATRAPFLFAGYGADADAWRIGLAARTIAAEGRYVVSRFPGYPVPEIVSAFFSWGAPVATNALSAVMCAASAVLLASIVRALGGRHALLAGAALAFTPVVFINSTASMDYVWALAFLLASLRLAIADRPSAAGAMLGVAAGCRVSILAMAVPLAVAVWASSRYSSARGQRSAGGPAGIGSRARAVAVFLATSAGVAAVLFSPVVAVYGSGALTILGDQPLEQTRALERMTVEVWGWAGNFALAAAVLLAAVRLFRPAAVTAIGPLAGTMHPWSWALAIAMTVAGFFAMPLSAGYRIPAVPFVLLLFARLIDRRAFVVLAIVLVISPWIGLRGGRPCPGQIFRDARVRGVQMAEARGILEAAEALEGPALVIVGRRNLPRLKMMLPPGAVRAREGFSPATNLLRASLDDGVELAAWIDADEHAAAVGSGARIWFVTSAEEWNRRRGGFDLRQAGARELPVSAGGPGRAGAGPGA